MVHALSRARGWLAPHGRLADIRPTPEPAHLEVRTGTTIVRAGDLQDGSTGSGPRTRHLQADAALADALARGWFELEARRELTFRRHADTVGEMREYTRAKWTDACLTDETLDRAAALLAAHPTADLWLTEQLTLSRLRPR
jgi:hypothetical protein